MGTQELIIIFLILFLLFGASRLPQLGSSIGSAIRNFKKGFAGDEEKAAEDKKLAHGDPNSTITSQDKAKQS
jgi:sec-independent protein translocase protein TatA